MELNDKNRIKWEKYNETRKIELTDKNMFPLFYAPKYRKLICLRK